MVSQQRIAVSQIKNELSNVSQYHKLKMNYFYLFSVLSMWVGFFLCSIIFILQFAIIQSMLIPRIGILFG